MDSASETLLIIVSVTLSVFLAVATIALILLIRFIKQLGRIANKAEHVANSVESAAESFEKRASSMAVLGMIANIIEKAANIKKGRN